ncbi:R3H domain-containing protein 1-like [Phoenix dactylifera]|uniref:R3H domain-containing protein 1-like n=1 Tax=Phoenix dactylifera TaxID=42345 RepID=A0A8B7MTN1_PHODC|nr:R3H domain-containing protein 1-like [Phoenix dactylifera]
MPGEEMESPASCSADAGAQREKEGVLALVDPFLAEALENPRHRLSVLRMELEIQKFMWNSDQYQFEFQHLPTSYLRCAAHRVAQHYGLQTMAPESIIDGLGSRVIARKTPDSKFPAVSLSEVPTKPPEKETNEQVKIAIRPRPSKASPSDAVELGIKRCATRTVEERKEEYDKARARIFSSSSSPEVEQLSSSADGRSMCSGKDEQEHHRTSEENEKTNTKDGTSRVAIFRDREKDRSDPDYDRSYGRYVRGLKLGQNFGLGACNALQSPFLQYETGISQFCQLPGNQTPMNYNLSNLTMNPFCSFGCNQTTKEAVYMQWPNPAVSYENSYEHFRHGVFEAPFYQQPLSFEHTQNC